MGEPVNRFARPSIHRARFVAAGFVAAAVSVAALAFMVAGVDKVEVLATLLFAPVVIAAIVGGRKMGYAAAVVATVAYLGLRLGDLDDSGTGRVLVLVAARAACFGVVAYATPLLADRVPSLARPTVSGRHRSGSQAMQEWEQAEPPDEYVPEDSFAFSEPVPAESPAAAPSPWDEPSYARPPYGEDPYAPPVEPAAYGDDPYAAPAGQPPGYGDDPYALSLDPAGQPVGYGDDPYALPLDPAGQPVGYGEDPYAAPLDPAGQPVGYGEDPYAAPLEPAGQPTAWDNPPAVEPVANPWSSPPEPAPMPAAAPGPPPGPPDDWAPPLEPAAGYPPPPAPGEWAQPQEPESVPGGWGEQQPYMGSSAAAPSVPTGWIDDATVPLGDETIPVGFTGELFLPRELREHPLVEPSSPMTNGNGSSNGRGAQHLADPVPDGASSAPPQSPFAGEVSLSPPGPGPGPGPGAGPRAGRGPSGPGPRRDDSEPQRRVGDTGEHHRGVDPETRLWNAHFFRDRLTQARDDSRRSGAPFSLVMVQVADEPFQPLPYRRQVALLRELGHQFVQARVLDHLVHLPDGAQHWFAVILPDTDSAGAHLVERRLRSAIAGYLRSRGLRIGEVQSASLTSPDDDEALASVWASLLGSTSV